MSYQHQYVDGTRIHFPLGKVVCIGRNYAEHAKELDNPVPTEPLLFIKPGSCVVPLEGGFSIPADRGSVHYEAEIEPLYFWTVSNTHLLTVAHLAKNSSLLRLSGLRMFKCRLPSPMWPNQTISKSG